MVRSKSPPAMVPMKAMVTKTSESSPCPTRVEPMVRVQSQRPWVSSFIRERTAALANSPTR
ncbi:hypothetical protein HRbin26_01513 [bacterium HR26]|nr:hypothetical protein HRbin26_01513 [bacterium HR26]